MGRDVLHISNKLECWKEMETASLFSECVHEDPCIGKRMITLALSFFSSVRWLHVLCMAYGLHEWLPIPLVFASFRHTSAPKRFFLLLPEYKLRDTLRCLQVCTNFPSGPAFGCRVWRAFKTQRGACQNKNKNKKWKEILAGNGTKTNKNLTSFQIARRASFYIFSFWDGKKKRRGLNHYAADVT